MWCSSAARSRIRGARERWDSLRLLTPNWQSRLPGFGYEGDDPDGFRTMPETVDFIVRYARSIAAPVRTETNVTSVRPCDDGYLVVTDRGDWNCRTVVLAAGACNIATVPALAAGVPASDRDADPEGLPQSRAAAGRRRARRRRVGDRHPARRRDPPVRAAL